MGTFTQPQLLTQIIFWWHSKEKQGRAADGRRHLPGAFSSLYLAVLVSFITPSILWVFLSELSVLHNCPDVPIKPQVSADPAQTTVNNERHGDNICQKESPCECFIDCSPLLFSINTIKSRDPIDSLPACLARDALQQQEAPTALRAAHHMAHSITQSPQRTTPHTESTQALAIISR